MDVFEQKKEVTFDKPSKIWESEEYFFPEHWHEEYEMIYMLEGEGRFLADKKESYCRIP